MTQKITWYLLADKGGGIVIGNDHGARVTAPTRAEALQAAAALVRNTADVFAALIEREVDSIKFTVEY